MENDIQVKPRLSPKDFVLYAGAMIALYVSVFALLALLFQYVDYSFRDALGYMDPYNTGMRIAMATLIVFAPLYVWLTRVLNQDMRHSPEKRELGFRKWLLYITLLIAGIGIAIDLVVLINTFLGGEITTRFILKALAVFVVAGAVFGYYLADLRGYWQMNEAKSKLVGVLALLAILVSIISGFFIMGSPADQRLIRFDQQKVADLQNIQWQVLNYWQSKQKLPVTLVDLNNTFIDFTTPTDPQNGASYEYAVIPGTLPSFKLCANFNKADQNVNGMNGYSAVPYGGFRGSTSWNHDAGTVCFTRTIDPDIYPPINKGL